MSRVWSCNEWDTLEEVIVGNPFNARFPYADKSTQVAAYPERPVSEIPQGSYPGSIIEETQEDLNEFVDALQKLGVTVKRPDTWATQPPFPLLTGRHRGITTTVRVIS